MRTCRRIVHAPAERASPIRATSDHPPNTMTKQINLVINGKGGVGKSIARVKFPAPTLKAKTRERQGHREGRGPRGLFLWPALHSGSQLPQVCQFTIVKDRFWAGSRCRFLSKREWDGRDGL